MIFVTLILYLLGTPALAEETQGHIEAEVQDIATLNDDGTVTTNEPAYMECTETDDGKRCDF